MLLPLRIRCPAESLLPAGVAHFLGSCSGGRQFIYGIADRRRGLPSRAAGIDRAGLSLRLPSVNDASLSLDESSPALSCHASLIADDDAFEDHPAEPTPAPSPQRQPVNWLAILPGNPQGEILDRDGPFLKYVDLALHEKTLE